jgi:micrococcal nuclease
VNVLTAILSASLLVSGSYHVVDGDTFDLGNERIRIANIDAPETRSAKCDAEKRLGIVAKRRLETLLNSQAIVISRGDPTDGRKKDRHGRTLATISIGGEDIGKIMIAEGVARAWKGKREPWCDHPQRK